MSAKPGDLLFYTQTLALTGELARGEPQRLRYRLLQTAGRLAFHARQARLRLRAAWPWRRIAARLDPPDSAPLAPRPPSDSLQTTAPQRDTHPDRFMQDRGWATD